MGSWVVSVEEAEETPEAQTSTQVLPLLSSPSQSGCRSWLPAKPAEWPTNYGQAVDAIAAQRPCSISPNRSASWPGFFRMNPRCYKLDGEAAACQIKQQGCEARTAKLKPCLPKPAPEPLAGSTLPELPEARFCLQLPPLGPPASLQRSRERKKWRPRCFNACLVPRTVSHGRWIFHI